MRRPDHAIALGLCPPHVVPILPVVGLEEVGLSGLAQCVVLPAEGQPGAVELAGRMTNPSKISRHRPPETREVPPFRARRSSHTQSCSQVEDSRGSTLALRFRTRYIHPQNAPCPPSMAAKRSGANQAMRRSSPELPLDRYRDRPRGSSVPASGAMASPSPALRQLAASSPEAG